MLRGFVIRGLTSGCWKLARASEWVQEVSKSTAKEMFAGRNDPKHVVAASDNGCLASSLLARQSSKKDACALFGDLIDIPTAGPTTTTTYGHIFDTGPPQPHQCREV